MLVNKIVGSKQHEILSFLTKHRIFKTIFNKVLSSFWKTFLYLKQFFNDTLLISRLSFFSVPKITVVQHV